MGVDFFVDILAFESDLLLKDLRTFSQNLKQLWIVLIHVNIVFHSSSLCLGILTWGKCYHCQLDSNFMPTAQLYKFPKTQMLLVDTRRYISNNYILKCIFCCLLLFDYCLFVYIFECWVLLRDFWVIWNFNDYFACIGKYLPHFFCPLTPSFLASEFQRLYVFHCCK